MNFKSVIFSVPLTANWLACLTLVIWICYSIRPVYGRSLAYCMNYSPWICYLRTLFITTLVFICIYFSSGNLTCRGQSSEDAAHDSHIKLQQTKAQNAQQKFVGNGKKLKDEQLENLKNKMNNLDKHLANVTRQLDNIEKQLELMENQLEVMAKQLEVMAKLLHTKNITFSPIFGLQFLQIAGLLALVLYVGILITLAIIRFRLRGISARNISEMTRCRAARTVFVIILIIVLFNLVMQWKLLQELQELKQ